MWKRYLIVYVPLVFIQLLGTVVLYIKTGWFTPSGTWAFIYAASYYLFYLNLPFILMGIIGIKKNWPLWLWLIGSVVIVGIIGELHQPSFWRSAISDWGNESPSGFFR